MSFTARELVLNVSPQPQHPFLMGCDPCATTVDTQCSGVSAILDFSAAGSLESLRLQLRETLSRN